MQIKLPALSVDNCLAFTACGEIKSDVSSVSEALKVDREFVVHYQQGRDDIFLRLQTGQGEKDHIHIDCALPAFFPEGKIPKATNSVEELQDLFSIFEGLEVSVGIMAEFAVLYEKLPDDGLVRSLSKEVSVDNITIQLRGADYKLTGTPLDKIEWRLMGDDTNVRVNITASIKERFNVDYLENLFSWLQNQFNKVVLGAKSDGE